MANEPKKEDPKKAKPEEDPKTGAMELAVHDRRGNLDRVYTYEVHGDRMQEYAEEYAKRTGGEVRKHK